MAELNKTKGSTMNVKESVLKIIASVCEIEVEKISEQSTVGDFPSWDSMAQLRILQEIESELNVSFEPEELMEMEDVGDIIKVTEGKLQG